MRPDVRILSIAESVRLHREELVDLSKRLEDREEPLTVFEAHLILDAADVRLKAVQDSLWHEAHHGSRPWPSLPRLPWRRLWARIRSWTKPRIGRLRHYEPRPLVVPARYHACRPPEAAPTISIVTPSFQQGRFLGRTLYSVTSQKYPALEYVVQDGGSTDETIDVLHRFGPTLTRWVSEPDDGQADAINRGFRETSGEIMAWLNSDDLFLPGALAYVAKYFAENPGVDVVYGNRLMIDDNDGQVGAWILPAHDDLALTLADYIPQETLFWRRSVWEAAGGHVDTSFGYALDWDMLLRFREAGARMVRLPRFLGAFRIHDEQKTTAADTLGMEECALLRERVHGRHVSIEEVLARLKPYFLRHILVHSRQRFVDRMPLRRVPVQTVPHEPWLRAPSVDAQREHGRPHRSTVLVSPLVPAPPDVPLPRELPGDGVAAAATANGGASRND